jgi:hypothetical protein
LRSSVRAFIAIAAVATSIGLAESCGSSTAPAAKTFAATMTGAKQIPAVSTSATGTATFTDNTTSIDYAINVTGITAVNASHIHLGDATTNGAIIINLFIPATATGTVNGSLATGTITATTNPAVSLDSLRVLFTNGKAYVNVHTNANPGGEIRGQVVATVGDY